MTRRRSYPPHPADTELLDKARDALIRDVIDGAGGQIESQSARQWVRDSHAAYMLCNASRDSGVMLKACDAGAGCAATAAHTPAGTTDDVACKLAWVVREMTEELLEELEKPSVLRFALVASALSDLVIIGGKPITVPPRAMEEVSDTEDATFWLARAAAETRRG